MFGRSPPNILATTVVCFLLFLQFQWFPTQAKPYSKQEFLSTYTAGVREEDWPEFVNYKNGQYIERSKRSPTEVEDETLDSLVEKTLSVRARKRQGIETPIQPLNSDSGLHLPHLSTEANVRSTVDQPDSQSDGVTVEEEKKAVDDVSNTNESKESDNNVKPSTENESNEGHQDENVSSSTENVNENKQGATESKQDKADSSKVILNTDSSTENKTSKGTEESKADLSRSVDENAQVRTVQEGASRIKKLGNIPNDKSGSISSSPEKDKSGSVTSTIKTNQQKIQTTTTNNVTEQQVDTDVSKLAAAKPETTGLISSDKKPEAPIEKRPPTNAQLSSQESKPINIVPQINREPGEPVRDALGNSGSEIVTTHSPREAERDSYTERDAEPKASNGPEVGHFQVDDKSADLEINANSAGVKVKAKPASLQVVSRPGSHAASGAQDRSFFSHYHYPPYLPHHHWYPGFRRSYGHIHRRHSFNPYAPFPERRSFERLYDEAPFYRRRLHYWYPHRHRHHFQDSYLYERSQLEEPEEFSRYRRRRRHKRRFRHVNGPYRRQFSSNNIPIMNGMESPQMGVPPEEGTMPQLPIGPGQPFAQRQNIITPMPPPINVAGNPPPGLLGGMNAANFAMNEMNNFNGLNQVNSAFNGIGSIGTTGFNTPEKIGAIEGLPIGMNGGLEEIQAAEQTPGMIRELPNRKTLAETPRKAFKKTAIVSGKKNNHTITKEHSHHQTTAPKNNDSDEGKKMHTTSSTKKAKINLKSWEKTLKRYHRFNKFTSKSHQKHQFRRSTKSSSLDSKTKNVEGKRPQKRRISHLHSQRTKDTKGKRKNEIVMHRPPIIYHPPPEIYHRPDIVVHRAPIMLHRPPIIYHQPPVVVHRPAIIYHQPPIVFHQPPPMVHQPILHSHDTWVTKPMVYHTASTVSHDKTYFGIPSHVYTGTYGEGCHGGHCSYRKGSVPHRNNSKAEISTLHKKKTKRDSLSDYMAYFTSLWKANGMTKRNVHDDYDFITSRDGAKQKLIYTSVNSGGISKRDSATDYNKYIHSIWNHKDKRKTDDLKNGTEKKKKKDVVVNRPPIIYHPPPEIYHRPDIVVHRPPLVIHRPPIIYHQPPVIVHRPAVVYHQPPIVFHQPPPAVSQPLLYSHDSFTVHPSFYATHHGSVVRDFGHYVGVPNVITNYGNPLFGRGPPIGKRSKIEKPNSINVTSSNSSKTTETSSKKATLHDNKKKEKNDTSEKAGKKNTVLVHRPPIIYHPPPEIYHRPVIIVHRPPIMIHRAPIFYHQPPVVIHRPAIVYHQPPLIFHQPPPMVHQPILRSHDTWISHHVVVPYSSRVMHHHTYVGVPDAFTVHHYTGGDSFYKSHILRHTNRDDEHASERNEITGKNKSTEKQNDLPKKKQISSQHKTKHTLNLKIKKAADQKGGKKNAVIVRRPPVIYHPPPEIYHRPEIVVHRAPIVIHRAPIIYHQPPVIVHRPAIVYHQPALIFHQPPPVVHQPFYRSHDTYVHMPMARLYTSRIHHIGHAYHIPHAYYRGHGGVIHHMAYDKSKVPLKQHIKDEKGETRTTVKKRKKSKTQKTSHHAESKYTNLTKSKDKTETGTKLHKNLKILYHKAKETTEKANKKNSVVIHRPPIIYHPPPEIYHRPDIVVHRAPIVLYRAPIVYHQPPVVVHRPAIVYHQPAIVFHQPPPMVHQPVLRSHDTWVTKPVVIPYASHVHHIATYRGVPHEEIFMHGIGTGAFGKSRVPVSGTRRNQIDSVDDTRKNQTDNTETNAPKTLDESNDKERNHTMRAAHSKRQRKETIGAAERITRALTNSFTDNRLGFIREKNPVGAGTRIQRSLQNIFPANADYSSLTALNPHNSNEITEQSVGPVTRIQRSKGAFSSLVGAGARIQRAVAEPWNTLEGENPYQMNKRSSEESENSSTPDENADKNTNNTKKTVLIIHRPPILYHPPSHMIHRPSIVVHRPDIIVHRHPIVFHRPPILVHRPPIIIHRQPVLIHRPPVIVHRPPLVFHRPPIIIHRRPYIIHHHPVMFHRPPIIIHRGPQMIVHHSHLIHHYPMHMIHMHCPGCGFGKSTVARLQGKRTDQDNKKTSHSDKQQKDATFKDSQRKGSNLPKRSVADKKLKKMSREEDHNHKRKGRHKKKKDVVVNRPPIIYHPPPEVYHRPDIVVHRAPILIHRPPIVYHQPPVVVHRPAVVYHQPPIVFHQPAPAVNQPLLFSHDSFVVHPMAFASHMGSVVNNAGHYVGLPHGGVSNYPGSIPHGPTGHIFPYLNSPNWSRRAQVSKPQDGNHTNVNHGKNSNDRKRSAGMSYSTHRSAGNSRRLVKQESKETKGEKKNKVIVARPPLIYHPPPEIYDRPDIIVHRPNIVIHQPSVVYHQPSVVVHRAPVVYQQPPVVFHQPAPMVSQPVYHAHDTYIAHPVYHPQESHISHSATYVGAPHYYPGYNSYGWGLQGNVPTAHIQPTPQIAQYGYTNGPAYPGFNGYTPYSASLGNAFGRSKVENKKKDQFKEKETKLKNATKKSRSRRSLELRKRHLHHHHHRHHHHHHRHHHIGLHSRGKMRFYPFHPMRSFSHVGHRKHIVIIHQSPLIYHPPQQVYHRPDILMRSSRIVEGENRQRNKDKHSNEKHDENNSKTKGAKHPNIEKAKRKNTVLVHRPAMIYHPPPEIYHRPDIIVHRPDIIIHRPSIVYHQPSVLVHKPPIIYRQPPVVFHQPPPMVHAPVLHAHDSYLAYPVALPYSSKIHHAATYVGAPHFFDQPHFGGFGGNVEHAFGKSNVEGIKKKHHSNEMESKNKKYTSTEVEKNSRSTRDVNSKKTSKENTKSTSTGSSEGHKKNKVIINRPPLIYHPPSEIYDRPDVIVHRPDIVIHRPSIVYHQSSVVVHRPPIVYQAPSVVFHQPPPLVNQPIIHAHDTYVAHPVPEPYTSHTQHTSTYVGSPHHYPGGWHYGWSQPQPNGVTWSQHHPFGLAFGKSNVPAAKSKSSEYHKSATKHKVKRAEKDQDKENEKTVNSKSEGISKKKNQVLIQRPPLIYHPPPDVYHKPDIIVHRPDIVIHRPSVVYHQPSVVVHRPPVLYHQPPVVFHQPSPMVSQPILHAHDTLVTHPYFTPYPSNLYHCGSNVGAPHCYNGGWGEHGFGFAHAFGKSKIQVAHKKQNHQRDKNKDRKVHRRTPEKETKDTVDEIKLKKEDKTVRRAKKKNLVIMRRPPLIYHPPPEIYHKPNVIVHRPDIVIHRPSVVFHQPSVVVHRPPVIYHQPPVIFHQPAPMVHQPIIHAHDRYFAHPHFVPFTSHLHHAGSYVGAPHFYPGGWSFGGHSDDFHHAFGKSKVEKTSKQRVKSGHENKDGNDHDNKRHPSPEAAVSSEENKHKGKTKDVTTGQKKNVVIMRRPPLIYHPPPEIYHKPDIILHRPDIVIHRPSVVFHQPSVVIHRAPVIYHQPPVVFHQPSPMVHQPIFHSHETYVAHPHYVPYLSHLTHAGSYVGAPHFFPGHWGTTHGFGHFVAHAFGKSKVEKGAKQENGKAVTPRKKSEEAVHFKTKREAKHENLHRDLSGVKEKSKLKQQYQKVTGKTAGKKAVHLHPEKETKKGHHKAHRKNLVLIQRPALIYHPPPEIYDRPEIIVHRPDVVIHQPSVVYHQPSVVVHRPPIIYRPPPVVFHQPAPMVHQPMYTSHDIYHAHPNFVPYASHIKHTQTYVGAPHYFPGGWRYGYGVSKASVPQQVGLNGWNVFNSPWYQSSLYRANYLTPTGVALPSSIRRRYQSAFAKSTDVALPSSIRRKYQSVFAKSDVQKHIGKAKDLKINHKNKHKGSQKSRNRRSTESTKRRQGNGRKMDEGGKKNVVMIRRPPLVYHPPPEIYHKPDVIVHRPDVVIHQPSVVYHQPSVMVHRPPVIYNQPPVVFHQPPPMVNQPIFHAHEHYTAHPYFVPYASQIHHAGTYLGTPEFFHDVRAFGKSDVSNNKSKSKKPHEKSEKKNKMVRKDKRKSTKETVFHPQEEKEEKPTRKNEIVVSRPPIIYHPPPEIYHRPDIVVHRAPIVLHRPPIIYHQPPVVVHRPAVVYHQPPVVFHQPPPTVHQPILHSHDSFVVRPAAKFFPQGSTLTHTMNYVGIPNHVIHGDELAFHHFRRSQIKHSGRDTSYKKPSTVQVAKSTISKIPTTNKENTETTITDQTQKKTLRSIIRHHKLTKRQLIGSHSLFGSFSPLNNIQDSQKSVEQNEKLSTIPGDISNRENTISKRQLIAPESIVFPNFIRNSLPSVYNTLEMASLQNQALAASEDSPESNEVDQVHLPGLTSTLPTLHGIERAEIQRYPLLLKHYQPGVPKDDSPDIRVHVETAKSSIPIHARAKRQIFPIFQQQEPPQVSPVLYQSPGVGNLEEVIHKATPSSVYSLFSPYSATSHPVADPYHYPRIPSVPLNHPHVNINVQSARSTIPEKGHTIQKRPSKKRSKRQFLALMPPLSSRLPVGLRYGMMPLPFSPYSAQSRFPYPLLPRLDYPQESQTEEAAIPEALRILQGPSSIPHTPYRGFSEDEDNDSSSFNPIASYLAALYNGYFGSPFYGPHKKPKVHVEVHASKSQIPKVKENTKYVHSRISKRQLYSFLPRSPLIENRYTLPTAFNYGIQGYHHNSPRVSINVETAKRQGIPSWVKEKRSPVAKKLKQHKQTRTGDKRDELLQNGENAQEISPYQENSNSLATQDNQFDTSRESSQPQEEIATNNNEPAQVIAQRQQLLEEAGQQEEQQEAEQQQEGQQQTFVQQSVPFPNQLPMMPFQTHQLAFRAPLTPMQVPMQPPGQPAFNVPSMAPIQGVIPDVLPGASSNTFAEQSTAQPGLDTGEGQPKHTSINVNVAAKSIVPKKTWKKNNKYYNRKYISSQQGYIPKETAMEKGFEKRERISLLTRFPAMQVLPQTFKQNGVLMPAFNTLPVNHRIKANGMLLEELQRQRKQQIPKTAKNYEKGIQTDKKGRGQAKQKENANKRQFYISPAMLPSQPYVSSSQPKVHLRPKVSVNVEVSKRKSAFPNGKFHLELTIQRPVVNTPLVRQIPLKVQRPRVSVHGERAKKKRLREQALKRQQSSDEKRQIYGFSELPNEGIMQQPLSLGSQKEPLGYLSRALHSPHISINVEASKRSQERLHNDIQKRQLLGLQPNVKETLDQVQVPVPSGETTYQSDDIVEENAAQFPIEERDQSRGNELSPMAIESNPAMTQQQQVQDLPPDGLEPQNPLSDILNNHPRVSVHVEASKRGENERKLRNAIIRKRSVKEQTGGKRQLQQMEQGTRDYLLPSTQGQRTVMNTQQVAVEQQGKVSQPLNFLSPIGQQQNVEQLQPVTLPVAQPEETKARPKVSITVETAKSSISKHRDHVREHVLEKKTKRQLFGTVPLLSSLGQTTVPGESGKIINPRSSVTLLTGKPAGKKDLRLQRRQLYNYLGGQQEQILPTEAIQDTTESEQQQQQQQQQQQDIPIQASQPDAPVNLQQASVLESGNQYQDQIQVPENTQTAFSIPTQSESSLNPLGALHRPRVSINVQTAKSKVPNTIKAKIPKPENEGSSSHVYEKKKFKRQFDILGGGGEIERRRGPKFLTAPPLKKGRGDNLFGLGTTMNKPVQVFADPIANLVAGRKRPKLGGIQIDSPTDVGALRLKGGANPLGGALASDVGAPAIIQDSATAGIAPFFPEPAVTGNNPFLPPSGIAGPRIDALGKGDTGDFPIAEPLSNRPAIIPLPDLNQAMFQDLPLATATAPLRERPLLISPRVFPVPPILPLEPPMAVPPPMVVPPEALPQPVQTLDEAGPVLQHGPQIGAIFPPVIPMPLPNIAAPPPLPKPETLIPETNDDKPSVHVNVETSRSDVPDTKHHPKHQATGRANRG